MKRLRAITTAAACALALVVAVPGSASAETQGNFYYLYTQADGTEKQANREELETQKCYNLPEMENSNDTKPAHSPDNKTEGTAYLYELIDCRGAKSVLKKDAKGGVNLKFRSAYFPQQKV
ncbi:hypothetical protein ACQEVX_18545 [Streptomyces syringium]|uniref:hypothetical protein n=1 Tax=Streptomyces syringium TaxID=76729 RepID=UPI003D8F9690